MTLSSGNGAHADKFPPFLSGSQQAIETFGQLFDTTKEMAIKANAAQMTRRKLFEFLFLVYLSA